MKINKPIFIIGSGRSGTTVFYNFFSTHPDLCWFSNYSDKFVNFRLMPLLHRILDFPLVGVKARKNIINASGPRFNIRPVEAQKIYHEYCGFKHAVKMTEDDLDVEAESKFKKLITRHCMLTGKTRFVNKQTANIQRIRGIHQMFKDAYYIHVIRDGRAVANSLYKVRWWKETDIWWLGKKTSEWDEQGRESIELCALHWDKEIKEILQNKVLFEDRYVEVKYEDFAADVKNTMNRLADFCELGKSEQFIKMLPNTLRNMNYKWQKDLTENQKLILNNTLKPLLNQLGYD